MIALERVLLSQPCVAYTAHRRPLCRVAPSCCQLSSDAKADLSWSLQHDTCTAHCSVSLSLQAAAVRAFLGSRCSRTSVLSAFSHTAAAYPTFVLLRAAFRRERWQPSLLPLLHLSPLRPPQPPSVPSITPSYPKSSGNNGATANTPPSRIRNLHHPPSPHHHNQPPLHPTPLQPSLVTRPTLHPPPSHSRCRASIASVTCSPTASRHPVSACRSPLFPSLRPFLALASTRPLSLPTQCGRSLHRSASTTL